MSGHVPRFASPSRHRSPQSVGRIALLGTALIFALGGCASHHDRIQPVREAFFHGRIDEALTELDRKKDLRLRNGDVKQLDRAMILLAAGQPKQAEQVLRQVRDRFDHLEQKSLAEKSASFLMDDNVNAYSGEDYERVLIRAFLALSNLMTDGGDAAAYAMQMAEKQEQVILQASQRNPEEANAVAAYKRVALGPYIQAMLAEESPLTLDEAARARAQVVNFEPGFRDGKSDLQRASHEAPLAPGHGALYVFALVGRGPVKEEVAEVPTQAALLIADRIISNNSNRGLPPTLAPVKVPKIRREPRSIDAVSLRVGPETLGQTATLVDIGAMAESQHEARYPQILAEAVARRVLKKAVIYAVKEGIDSEQWSASSIALSAAGVAWEAMETADTRSWSLLPDQIQVLRVELPAGEHDLTLQPVRGVAPLGMGAPVRVTIRDGRHTCLLAHFPADRLVGQVLISGQEPAGQVRIP